MGLVRRIKSIVGAVVRRDKPVGHGDFPIGGQQQPGEASDFESWPPHADRNPGANTAATPPGKPSGGGSREIG